MKFSALILALGIFPGFAHAQSTFTTPPAGDPRPRPVERFHTYWEQYTEYDRSYGPCNMHEALILGCETEPRFWGADRCRCPKR